MWLAFSPSLPLSLSPSLPLSLSPSLPLSLSPSLPLSFLLIFIFLLFPLSGLFLSWRHLNIYSWSFQFFHWTLLKPSSFESLLRFFRLIWINSNSKLVVEVLSSHAKLERFSDQICQKQQTKLCELFVVKNVLRNVVRNVIQDKWKVSRTFSQFAFICFMFWS